MTQTQIGVRWISLGRQDYNAALETQMTQAEALLARRDESQTVYTVEHPPTITIGRSGTFNHIIASRQRLLEIGMSIYEVDRGGDVTYHGPGQLVVYPILHLSPWNNDVGLFIRLLEETVIQALSTIGLRAGRQDGYPGVWIGDRKICAVGARVKRRLDGEFVTAHGLALNVSTDLSHFDTIVPCGIADKGVTSIARELNVSQSYLEWEERVREAFTSVFGAMIL